MKSERMRRAPFWIPQEGAFFSLTAHAGKTHLEYNTKRVGLHR